MACASGFAEELTEAVNAHEPTDADWAKFGAWVDGERWELVPELLPLDGYIDHEADRYRRAGTLAGELIARQLAELASMVRLVRASTPASAMDRIATLERDREWYATS